MKKRNLGYAVALACCTALSTGNALAVSVPVNNSQFGSPTLPVTNAPADGRGSWGLAGWAGGEAGTYSPDSVYPSQDGSNVGYLSVGGAESGGSAFYQDATRIKEGTYSLTVGVVKEPNAEPTTVPFQVNFEATGFGSGTTLLGENEFAIGTFDNTDLTTVTATLNIPSGSPEIGRYLRPVLLLTGQDAGSNPADPRASYNLDNVQIEFTPPAGSPESVIVGQHSFDPLVWQRPSGSGGNAGEYNPGSPVFANQVGDQLGFISVRDFGGSWGALFQDTATIAEGTYTWTVGVAHDPGFEPTSAPLSLNFEAVGGGLPTSLLMENSFAVGEVNGTEFTDVSVSVTIPAGSSVIGQDLRLVFVAAGQDAGTSLVDPRATYLFDNVRLDFAAVPEPTSVALAIFAMGVVGCGRSRKLVRRS